MFGPKKLDEACALFLRDAQGIWGSDLESVILYGSAATDAFRHGKSDVNFLIIAKDLSPEKLRKLQSFVKTWRKNRISTPLIMRRELVRTSLDSYPLEFLSMSVAYRVLHGDDVLANLELKKEDVRLQCERELKAKLLLLREAYIDSGGVRALLHNLVSESLPAMSAIFQGLLYLQDKDWKLTGDRLLDAGQEAFQLDAGLFRELWSVKSRASKPGADETHRLLGRYIVQIEKLADWADRGGLVEASAGDPVS